MNPNVFFPFMNKLNEIMTSESNIFVFDKYRLIFQYAMCSIFNSDEI